MYFIVLASAALAACPATQQVRATDLPDSPHKTDDQAAAMRCERRIDSCGHVFTYRGPGARVEVRGDFAADGWTNGLAMSRGADGVWTLTVSAKDEQVILYKYVVDGQWMADAENPRRSPDGFGGENSVAKVDCDLCAPRTAIDWRDAVMYFVLVDRFADGESANNAAVEGAEVAGNYQGGDLVGLRQKIEEGYFEELGVNTLWLSNPVDNSDGADLGSDGHNYSGYHGYWPKELDVVEARAGSEADLKAVIDAAHARGMQVLMDYVMNHVHASSSVYQAHPEWFWPNDNGQGGNCVCGHGCDWNSMRLRCWFDPFLPDFNFKIAEARKFSVDNALAWIKRTGLDGFRLDAVKHIETSWLTDLRSRISAEATFNQRFYLVGETYDGDRGIIKSYVNPDTMLDGQFDFPLRAAILRNVLRRQGSMTELATFMNSNDGFYGPNAVMGTFLGNHDVPRTIHIAEDQSMFDEWNPGKHRAWQNRPEVPTTPSAFERLLVAYTIIFTTPGVPMFYYGDEVGMPGAGDPDNRRFMQWSGYSALQAKLKTQLSTLAKIRGLHPALRRGTRRTLGSAAHSYVYQMTGGGETITVALNRADEPQPAAGLPVGSYKDLLSGATIVAPAALPARTAWILQSL